MRKAVNLNFLVSVSLSMAKNPRQLTKVADQIILKPNQMLLILIRIIGQEFYTSVKKKQLLKEKLGIRMKIERNTF